MGISNCRCGGLTERQVLQEETVTTAEKLIQQGKERGIARGQEEDIEKGIEKGTEEGLELGSRSERLLQVEKMMN